MKLLIVGTGAGLGPLLAERASASGLEVTLAAAASPSAEVIVIFPEDAGGRPQTAAVEQLLSEAAGEAPCRRLVYWGSHRVYAASGVRPLRPRLESAALTDAGVWRRWAEIDARLQQLTVRERFLFRAVPVAGRRLDGHVRALGSLPLVPLAPGLQTPIQLLHEEDALEVLWRAVVAGHPGTYNVASDGLLFLRRTARRLGRPAIPLPRAVAALLLVPWRATGRVASIRETLALAHEPLVLDNGRLKTHFGYRPRRSARTALAAALGVGGDGRVRSRDAS